ncbi:uncharacterized protein LOC134528886 [Bacillus rossius redtenbacheri]|uniref:uncharacterized protein LOC134528886 n=1 Tax=Bacillus rossius redtenbacheri TaxID=93214 RepID=UPI002FDC987D
MASKLRKTTFRDEWNQNPSLSWAQAIDGSPYAAWCKLCNHRIELSNMGKQAPTSHASGVKHSRRVQGFHMSSSIAVYCKTTRPTSAASQNNSASESSSPLSESSKLFSSDVPSSPQVSSPPLFQTDPVSSSKSLPDTSSNADNSYLNPSATCSCTCTCGSARKESKSLTNYLLNDSVTRAEILWCLYCVMAHNSLRNAENSVAMHRKMYHDSKIAAKLQLGKSKVSYTIVHGLAPEFQKELHADISKSSHLVVGFDESLNKIAQKQQMDISVRYWNEDDSITCTRYLTSAFLGHSTAADLLSAFKNSLPVNTLHKIIQVSMDGPNVNLRFLKDLKQDLKEGRTDEGVILDIGTCGLHSLHCAFKGAMKETGWEIVKFLRAIYNLFHNIPTRRADYIIITGSSLFPLKFCPVRWLDNVPVADRALKILPNLRNYVAGLKSNTEPTCASFVIVKSAIKDVLLGPKLAFFSSVAAEVEPLLKEYQTNDPMAPYLFSDFSSVIKNFMTRFVKADVMANTTLSKIDLSANNLLSRLNKYVRDRVRSCRHCQRHKTRRPDGQEQQIPRKPTEPFHTMALDLMAPYLRTARGKRFLLVVTDCFTWWVEAYPLSNCHAGTIARSLEDEFFSRWGYPQVLLTDNATQFSGRKWVKLCRKWRVTAHTTPIYHPTANPTEQRNQEIKAQLCLRLADDHTTWDTHIPDVLYCLRRNEATGEAPATLQGRNLPLPGQYRIPPSDTQPVDESHEARAARLAALRDAAQHRQVEYQVRVTPTPTSPPPPLTPGQLVYARLRPLSSNGRNYCAGLAAKWVGPVPVVRTACNTAVFLRLPTGRVVKYHQDTVRLARGEDEPEDETQGAEQGAPGQEIQLTPPTKHGDTSTPTRRGSPGFAPNEEETRTDDPACEEFEGRLHYSLVESTFIDIVRELTPPGITVEEIIDAEGEDRHGEGTGIACLTLRAGRN